MRVLRSRSFGLRIEKPGLRLGAESRMVRIDRRVYSQFDAPCQRNRSLARLKSRLFRRTVALWWMARVMKREERRSGRGRDEMERAGRSAKNSRRSFYPVPLQQRFLVPSSSLRLSARASLNHIMTPFPRTDSQRAMHSPNRTIPPSNV